MYVQSGKIELFRFRGIPVSLDWSVAIIGVILILQGNEPLEGLLRGASLLSCVLLHELGHIAVALSYGCRVREITLMLIGGRTTLAEAPRRPIHEAIIALVGPLISLALAGLAKIAFGGESFFMRINLMLGIFNLLPAFPMDGGRVFRALLSSRLGHQRTTLISFRLAQILAVCMAVYALFSGVIFNLIIWLFIAGSIFVSATAEYVTVRMRGGRGDEVIISPPPYGGKEEFTEIHQER